MRCINHGTGVQRLCVRGPVSLKDSQHMETCLVRTVAGTKKFEKSCERLFSIAKELRKPRRSRKGD